MENSDNIITQKEFYTTDNHPIDTVALRQSLTRHLGETGIAHHHIVINNSTGTNEGLNHYNITVATPPESARDVSSVVSAVMNIALYEQQIDKVAKVDVMHEGVQATMAGWSTSHDNEARSISIKGNDAIHVAGNVEASREALGKSWAKQEEERALAASAPSAGLLR